MRTLQEKYNGVNEGVFSKDQFLRDARLQLPNLVTQYNGYDDAVKILKNRGMIQEEKNQMTTAELMDMLDKMPAGEVTKDIFKGVSKDVLSGLKTLAKKGKKKLGDALVKFGYLEPGDLKEVVAKYSQAAFNAVNAQNLGEATQPKPTKKVEVGSILRHNLTGAEFKVTGISGKTITGRYTELGKLQGRVKIGDINKTALPLVGVNYTVVKENRSSEELVRENQAPKLTKKALADYRYKPTNDMDKYPYEQILRGLRVELEGLGVTATPTPEEYKKALAKVLKNLEKDEIFYTNQIAGIKANAKRTDLMVDATPKNEVDKENGLQKAQLKESFKKLIKNILSEGDEFGEGEEVYKMYGDSDGDYEHDKDTAAQAIELYDKGQELFDQGKTKQAEALRQQALEKASWLGWGDTDLPPYKTPEIPGFEGTRDALDNLFESVSLKDLLD